ncbi:MAG: tetratricopeptide repeat protein [Candidatus Peribacteraceae bacterium]|nr:tetratricopeptide repeat protein [Candidatus Peribacteraceae bacterium]
MIRGRLTHWLLVLLVAAPLVVYLPSVVRDSFVSIDDSLLITKNAAVQSLSPRNVAHVFTSYDPELYIPLTLFTYQIEWAIAGAQPVLFHLTNLLLHIGSGLFLFFLLRKIFDREWIAFFGALLFVLHPVHTEAVAWAAARKDVLSAFFFLWTLLLYESAKHPRNGQMARWAVVTFLAALLSKVTVVLLPLVLLMLDWRRGERIGMKNLREKIPYFALSAVFMVIALFGKAQGIGSLGLWKTMLLSAKAVIFYIQQLFWPVHLSVIYAQQTPVGLGYAEFWVPVLALIILIAGVGAAVLRPYRNIAFGLSFFLVTVIPNFANFWKNRFLFFASDRYAYIPSVGLIILLCAAVVWINRKNIQMKLPSIAVLSILSALFALFTFQQTRVWQTDLVLYQNVLRWYPDSALAANNLGDALVKSRKLDESIPWFAKAAEFDRNYVQAMTNAGNVERERGRFDAAQAWYEKAIAAIGDDPRIEDVAPHYLLGELLINMGKLEEGLAHFRTAVELLPDVSEPYYNLAGQLQALHRGDEAIPLFEKAISLYPNDIASRYHLAGLYAERGRLAEAKNQLEYVVSVDPGYEKASEHLMNIRKLLLK